MNEIAEKIYDPIIEYVTIPLTPTGDFKISVLFEADYKKRYLLYCYVGYKDSYISKNYAESVFVKETLSLFANNMFTDYDDSDYFKLSQKKDENGKVVKTLQCLFVEDEKVYINKSTARTIVSIWNQGLSGYSYSRLLEKDNLKRHYTGRVFKEAMNNIMQAKGMQIEPEKLPDAMKKYLENSIKQN
ncbi:MAG: hypothetical protein PHE67_07400 [Campylobacterales bacterium]|nr:hypothetical protein [Campylobacterales bacterium]